MSENLPNQEALETVAERITLPADILDQAARSVGVPHDAVLDSEVFLYGTDSSAMSAAAAISGLAMSSIKGDPSLRNIATVGFMLKESEQGPDHPALTFFAPRGTHPGALRADRDQVVAGVNHYLAALKSPLRLPASDQ